MSSSSDDMLNEARQKLIALIEERDAEKNLDAIKDLVKNNPNIINFEVLEAAVKCDSDNLEIVHFFKDQGANFKEKREDGNTLLHIAVDNRSVYMIEFLAEQLDVNAPDANGNTAMHLARSSSSISALLKFGANIDAVNRAGKTPLECAMDRELSTMISSEVDVSVSSALIESGANLELIRKDKLNNLVRTVENSTYSELFGDLLKIVQEYLSGNVEKKSIEKKQIMDASVLEDDQHKISNINDDDEKLVAEKTPVQYISTPEKELSESPTIKEKDVHEALIDAIENEDVDAVEKLVRNNKDVVDGDILAEAGRVKNLKIAKILVKNCSDNIKFSMLEDLLISDNLEVIKFMSDAGVRFKYSVGIGEEVPVSLLHVATEFGCSPDTIHYLIDQRIDVNIQTSGGDTPLHSADIPAAKVLLSRGAKMDVKNKRGETPLGHAFDIGFSLGDWDRVDFLIMHGASLDLVNKGDLEKFLKDDSCKKIKSYDVVDKYMAYEHEKKIKKIELSKAVQDFSKGLDVNCINALIKLLKLDLLLLSDKSDSKARRDELKARDDLRLKLENLLHAEGHEQEVLYKSLLRSDALSNILISGITYPVDEIDNSYKIKLLSLINNDADIGGVSRGGLYGKNVKYLSYCVASICASEDKVKSKDVGTLNQSISSYMDWLKISDRILESAEKEIKPRPYSMLSSDYEEYKKKVFVNAVRKELSVYLSSIERLQKGEVMTMPGGWVASPSGHAMIYQFVKNEQGILQFKIFNTGAGVENHDYTDIDLSRKYNHCLTYDVNTSDEEVLKDLLVYCIVPLKLPLIVNLKESAYSIYDNIRKINEKNKNCIVKKRVLYNSLEDNEKRKWSAGQISGTCSWRQFVQLMLNDIDDVNVASNLRYEIKIRSIIDSYQDYCLSRDRMSFEEKEDFLYALNKAIKNISRVEVGIIKNKDHKDDMELVREINLELQKEIDKLRRELTVIPQVKLGQNLNKDIDWENKKNKKESFVNLQKTQKKNKKFESKIIEIDDGVDILVTFKYMKSVLDDKDINSSYKKYLIEKQVAAIGDKIASGAIKIDGMSESDLHDLKQIELDVLKRYKYIYRNSNALRGFNKRVNDVFLVFEDLNCRIVKEELGIKGNVSFGEVREYFSSPKMNNVCTFSKFDNDKYKNLLHDRINSHNENYFIGEKIKSMYPGKMPESDLHDIVCFVMNGTISKDAGGLTKKFCANMTKNQKDEIKKYIIKIQESVFVYNRLLVDFSDNDESNDVNLNLCKYSEKERDYMFGGFGSVKKMGGNDKEVYDDVKFDFKEKQNNLFPYVDRDSKSRVTEVYLENWIYDLSGHGYGYYSPDAKLLSEKKSRMLMSLDTDEDSFYALDYYFRKVSLLKNMDEQNIFWICFLNNNNHFKLFGGDKNKNVENRKIFSAFLSTLKQTMIDEKNVELAVFLQDSCHLLYEFMDVEERNSILDACGKVVDGRSNIDALIKERIYCGRSLVENKKINDVACKGDIVSSYSNLIYDHIIKKMSETNSRHVFVQDEIDEYFVSIEKLGYSDVKDAVIKSVSEKIMQFLKVDKKNSSVDFESFPVIIIKTDFESANQEEYLINLIEGTVSKGSSKMRAVPDCFLYDPVFNYFCSGVSECSFVGNDKNHICVKKDNEIYYFLAQGSSVEVFKEFKIGDAVKVCKSIKLDSRYQSLMENGFHAWEENSGNIRILDRDNKLIYELVFLEKRYVDAPSLYQSYKIGDGGDREFFLGNNDFTENESVQGVLDKLSSFENQDKIYTFISKDEKNNSSYFSIPRYDVRFKVLNGSLYYNETGFSLRGEQSKIFKEGLIVKNENILDVGKNTKILIPDQYFYINNDSKQYEIYKKGKSSLEKSDVSNVVGYSDSKTERFYEFDFVDEKPVAKNSKEHLFLAYYYLNKHMYQEAFDELDLCKKTHPITGTAEELELLYNILEKSPDKELCDREVDSLVRFNPEIYSIKSKSLAMMLEMKSSFDVKKPESFELSAGKKYINKNTQVAFKFYNNNIYDELVHYKDSYFNFIHHVPEKMRLNPDEEAIILGTSLKERIRKNKNAVYVEKNAVSDVFLDVRCKAHKSTLLEDYSSKIREKVGQLPAVNLEVADEKGSYIEKSKINLENDKSIDKDKLDFERKKREVFSKVELDRGGLSKELMGAISENEKSIAQFKKEIIFYANVNKNKNAVIGRLDEFLDINDLIIMYLHGNIDDVMDQTGFDEEKSKKLMEKIGEYLVVETDNNRYHNIVDLIKKGGKSEDIVELMSLRRNYDPEKNREILLYEFYEKKTLRDDQVRAIVDLSTKNKEGKYNNSAFQLIMGGGKTSVLLPILALKKATGKNLVIVEVPHELLSTNLSDIGGKLGKAFGSKIKTLHFDRGSELSIEYLTNMETIVENAIMNKCCLMVSKGTLQALELKYLELLNNSLEPGGDKDKKNIEFAHKIKGVLRTIREKGDVMIDEGDSTLNIKKEFNYSVGEKRPIARNNFMAILSLYDLISDISVDDEKKVTLGQFLGGTLAFSFKNEKEVKKLIDSAVDRLMVSEKSPLYDFLKNSDKGEQEKCRKFLTCQLNEKENKEYIEKIKKTKFKDVICLMKQEVNVLLSSTLMKLPNLHYGLSKEKENPVLAIPYSANNTPSESSEFSGPYETLNYSLQLDYFNPIPEYGFRKVFDDFKSKHTMEMSKNNPGDTEAQIEFKKITGHDLLSVDEDTFLKIYEEVKNNKILMTYYLGKFLAPEVGYYPEMLVSDSINHADQFNSVQCVSGTLQNHNTFNDRIVFNKKLSAGTDGITVNLLEKKNPEVRSIPVSEIGPNNLSQFLKDQSISDFNAIIDVGALFRGVSNQCVAEKVGEVLRADNKNKILYVLYFDKNRLYALPVSGQGNPIPLSGSDAEYIAQTLNCKPNQIFTVYDQQHTTGTDIKQDDQAKALVTVGNNTRLRDLTQGVMRMRGLAKEQTVSFVVPESLKFNDKKIENVESIIDKTYQFQIDDLMKEHFQAALKKISGLMRTKLLDVVLSENITDQDELAVFKFCKDKFIRSVSDNPFEAYSGNMKKRSTKEIFEENVRREIELLKSFREKFKENKNIDWKSFDAVESELKRIAADSLDVCHEETIFSTKKQGSDNDGMSSQMEVEHKKELKSEVEQKTELELENVVDNKDLSRKANLDGDFCKLQTVVGVDLDSMQSGLFPVENFVSRDKLSADVLPFNKKIMYDKSFETVYEDSESSLYDKRNILNCLFRFDKKTGDLHCVLLNNKSAQAISKEWMAKGGNNASQDYEIWITPPSGKIFLSESPKAIKGNAQSSAVYASMLEQVRFMNGDTDLLLSQDKFLWINNPNDQKSIEDKCAILNNIILSQRAVDGKEVTSSKLFYLDSLKGRLKKELELSQVLVESDAKENVGNKAGARLVSQNDSIVSEDNKNVINKRRKSEHKDKLSSLQDKVDLLFKNMFEEMKKNVQEIDVEKIIALSGQLSGLLKEHKGDSNIKFMIKNVLLDYVDKAYSVDKVFLDALNKLFSKNGSQEDFVKTITQKYPLVNMQEIESEEKKKNLDLDL